MRKTFKRALLDIESLLEKKEVKVEEKVSKEERFTLLTDTYMSDAGLSYDNVVLDLFYDEDNQFLFIGLLRLPLEIRKQKISKEMVERLKSFAEQDGFTIFLDACGDTNIFWKKNGFKRVYIDQYDFEIMGYSKENDEKELIEKWTMFKQTNNFQKYLSCHE